MNWLVLIIGIFTFLMVSRILLNGVGRLPRRSDRSPRTRDWR